jgi:hypothetical protein
MDSSGLWRVLCPGSRIGDFAAQQSSQWNLGPVFLVFRARFVRDGGYEGGIMKLIMTVRLELKPDVEASLAAQARARGVPLDAYLQSVIEDLARAETAGSVSLQELEATLDTLAEMGRGLPHLPSSAFRRESIYRDHD